MTGNKKHFYVSPNISVEHIFTEESFAAGSAQVSPISVNEQVLDEWDREPNVDKTYTW